MISNPKNGWCNFKLRTFEGTPSYLTDVAIDLLDAFIDYNKSGRGIAWFDEEGTEFTLVINPYSLFVIEERGKGPILHDFSEMKIENLEKELINDIESDLDGWYDFLLFSDEKENERYRDELDKKIAELKQYIKEG